MQVTGKHGSHDVIVEIPRGLEDFSGTTDCDKCGGLLYLDVPKGKVMDFNQWMHAQDERWPINGENTGYINV